MLGRFANQLSVRKLLSGMKAVRFAFLRRACRFDTWEHHIFSVD
jgi:hypothetical protein